MPVAGELDLYLFGLFSSDTLSEEIERFLQGIAVKATPLRTVRIHLQPRLHFQEGLSPEYSVARRVQSATQLAEFRDEVFEDVSLSSSVQTTGGLEQGAVFRATHDTSVEIQILVDKVTDADLPTF